MESLAFRPSSSIVSQRSQIERKTDLTPAGSLGSAGHHLGSVKRMPTLILYAAPRGTASLLTRPAIAYIWSSPCSNKYRLWKVQAINKP